MTPTLVNAAIFFAGSRRFRNVNVAITDTEVVVLNMNNGEPMTRFQIVDTAKAGEAWDAIEVDGPSGVVRLVAQLGCGCSGMHPYAEDEAYKARQAASVPV